MTLKNEIYEDICKDYKEQILMIRRGGVSSMHLYDENNFKLRSPQILLFLNNKPPIFIEPTEQIQPLNILGLILTQFLGKILIIHKEMNKKREKYKLDSSKLLIIIPDQKISSKKPIQMNSYEEKIKSLFNYKESSNIVNFSICEMKNFKSNLNRLINE